jgi:hypothetical protein
LARLQVRDGYLDFEDALRCQPVKDTRHDGHGNGVSGGYIEPIGFALEASRRCKGMREQLGVR